MRPRSLQSPGGVIALLFLLLLQGQLVLSDIPIDVNSVASLKNAGKTIASPMMVFYEQNQTEGIPGKLTDTWYVAGAMLMTLIQYWDVTGDSQYNKEVSYDLMFQAGRNYDYFDSNYSQWLGNDDQMFWALACMTASETNFPEVPGKPTWTTMARAVFQEQIDRWGGLDGKCGGGLCWQISQLQDGYTLRNAISNGGLFQLAARLGHFTKNETYFNWAEKIWEWSIDSPLIKPADNWLISDSTSGDNDCADNDNIQWTYNYGTYLAGAAFMYDGVNGTDKKAKWSKAVNGMLDRTFQEFFPKRYGYVVMTEYACEGGMTCNRNHLCFKGWTAIWLAFVAKLVPGTEELILPKLEGSAAAIGKQCDGAANSQGVDLKNLCGVRWHQPTWDGQMGLEVQMSALGGIVSNLMLKNDATLLTVDTNPNASEKYIPYGNNEPEQLKLAIITTADRAGAWIVTFLIGGSVVASSWWLMKV